MEIWGLKDWRLISLGRGFYHIILTTEVNISHILSRGALALKPDILRLQNWIADFDPYAQKVTTTMIWVRFYKLPWEYWHSQLLVDILRGVGVALKIDNMTITSDFGHFTRMLIEADLTVELSEVIMLKKPDKSFFVDMVYENLPIFCSTCISIGHWYQNCRLIKANAKSRQTVRENPSRQKNSKKIEFLRLMLPLRLPLYALQVQILLGKMGLFTFTTHS